MLYLYKVLARIGFLFGRVRSPSVFSIALFLVFLGCRCTRLFQTSCNEVSKVSRNIVKVKGMPSCAAVFAAVST